MNADDFKPGDLAWGTVCDQRDVLLMRGWMGNVWISQFGPHGASTVTDLRPATILAPDERAVPKGHVDFAATDADAHRLSFALLKAGRGVSSDTVLTALEALAAEQQAAANPVPPEQVWTDGDVVRIDSGIWVRANGEWVQPGYASSTYPDSSVNVLSQYHEVHLLRQQVTGIGCENSRPKVVFKGTIPKQTPESVREQREAAVRRAAR